MEGVHPQLVGGEFHVGVLEVELGHAVVVTVSEPGVADDVFDSDPGEWIGVEKASEEAAEIRGGPLGDAEFAFVDLPVHDH